MLTVRLAKIPRKVDAEMPGLWQEWKQGDGVALARVEWRSKFRRGIFVMPIRKVLMVDDEQSIRRIAGLSLSRVGGWEVLLAESGEQAIEFTLLHNPDLILMDVMMPSMDGPTAFEMLRERHGVTATPVIFMTAKVLREERESYLKLGAAGVIRKPFDPLLLPSQIVQILKEQFCVGAVNVGK